MTGAHDGSAIDAVAVIGLGAMGGALAERLLECGVRTLVHDLDPSAIARLVGLGAEPLYDAAGAPASVACVVTSLPQDDVLTKVIGDGQLLEELGARVLIETSTVLPATMREIAGLVRALGIGVVDCALSGGPREARNGELVLLVGAEDADLASVHATVLAHLGRVEHVGNPGDGKALKLINNVMTLGNTVVAAEAFGLGVSLGLDQRRMFDVLRTSGGRSQTFEKRTPYVLDNDYQARFSVKLAEKDLRLALEVASDVTCALPTVRAALGAYESADSAGMAGEDIAAVYKLYFPVPKP